MANDPAPTKGQTDKSTWRAKGNTKVYKPPVKKQPGEVPMLQMYKGAQFHVFMDAISKAAMR